MLTRDDDIKTFYILDRLIKGIPPTDVELEYIGYVLSDIARVEVKTLKDRFRYNLYKDIAGHCYIASLLYARIEEDKNDRFI